MSAVNIEAQRETIAQGGIPAASTRLLPGGGATLHSIQALRAFAAWLVVAHHIMQLVFGSQASNRLESFLVSRGMAGVDIFFVISGFIMVYITAGRDPRPYAYLVRRILRIVPAYWFYTVLMLPLVLLVPWTAQLTVASPMSVIQSLLFVPHQNPSGVGQYPLLTIGWSLNYEMYFYVLFALCLGLRNPFRTPILVGVMLLITSFLPDRWSVDGFFGSPLIYEFLYGVVLGSLYCAGRLRFTPISSVAVLLLGLALIAFASFPKHVSWGFGAAAVVYGAIGMERFFARAPLLTQLGNWSYSTYLCHLPIIIGVASIQVRFMPQVASAVLVAEIVAAVAAISWLSYATLERSASRFLARRLLPIADGRVP